MLRKRLIKRHDDPLNEMAWAGFISWALGEREIVAQFNTHTGSRLLVGRNGFEIAIDKATGFDHVANQHKQLEQFIFWVTEHYWGMPYAPTKLKGRSCPMTTTESGKRKDALWKGKRSTTGWQKPCAPIPCDWMKN